MKKVIIGAVTGVVLSVAGVSGASAAMYAGDQPVHSASGYDHSDFDVFGTKWGAPVFGTGASVTWSLTATGVDASDEGAGTLTHLGDFMPIGYKVAIEAAFAAWSAIADITFTEVVDNGLPFNAVGATGDIRIAGHVFDGAGGTLAHGFYPPPNGASAAGDIHFDIGDTWKLGQGPAAGFDIFTVAAHEIGHAIGLGHTVTPDSLMNPFYTEDFLGLQADDIAGAQFIYGTTAVPIPAALPLLMGGLAMVGFVGRRKRAA